MIKINGSGEIRLPYIAVALGPPGFRTGTAEKIDKNKYMHKYEQTPTSLKCASAKSAQTVYFEYVCSHASSRLPFLYFDERLSAVSTPLVAFNSLLFTSSPLNPNFF